MRNGSFLFPKLWSMYCFLWAGVCVICSRSIILMEKYFSEGGKMCVTPFSWKQSCLSGFLTAGHGSSSQATSWFPCYVEIQLQRLQVVSCCTLTALLLPYSQLCRVAPSWNMSKPIHLATLQCFFLHICCLVERSSPGSSLPFYITISLSLVLVCTSLVCNIKCSSTRENRNIATECLVTLDSVAD